MVSCISERNVMMRGRLKVDLPSGQSSARLVRPSLPRAPAAVTETHRALAIQMLRRNKYSLQRPRAWHQPVAANPVTQLPKLITAVHIDYTELSVKSAETSFRELEAIGSHFEALLQTSALLLVVDEGFKPKLGAPMEIRGNVTFDAPTTERRRDRPLTSQDPGLAPDGQKHTDSSVRPNSRGRRLHPQMSAAGAGL